MRGSSQLRRNPAAGRIAGVAAGLSDFLGVDVTLIRVLLVVGTFVTSGAVPLLYVGAWILIPAANNPAQTPRARQPRRRGGAWTLAVVALVAAFFMAADNHMNFFIGLVMVVAVLLIWRKVRGRTSWRTKREFEKAKLAWQRRLDEQHAQSAPPANLGGDPFQIGSFYPQSPTGQYPTGQYPTGNYPTNPTGQPGCSTPDADRDNPTSGFQIQ